MLKQPLQTSVAVDTLEFEEFSVEDKLHVAISVKDFKAVVLHADTLGASISAHYSRPTRPMQLAYDGEGMKCEFTFMTIGDSQAVSGTLSTRGGAGVSGRSSRQNSAAIVAGRPRAESERSMPAMERRGIRSSLRTFTGHTERRSSLGPPKASLGDQSLFFPDADEDRRWDEVDLANQEEDVLGWDASADNVRTLIIELPGGLSSH